MKFDARNLLIGLVLLHLLPHVFTRPLYGDLSQNPKDQLQNLSAGYIPRAFPVALKPVAPKPAPPGRPGERTSQGELAPLVPGNKGPNRPVDKTPHGTPRLGLNNKDKDLELLCLRAPGDSCSKSPPLAQRGKAALDAVQNGDYGRPDPEWVRRLNDKYIEGDPYEQLEEAVESMSTLLDSRRIGLGSFDSGKWETRTVQNKGPDGKKHGDGLNILTMSYNRIRKDDPDKGDVEIFLAHERYASRDRNRYESPVETPRETWKQDSVPVWQMMHETEKKTKSHQEQGPDEFYFVSENVTGKKATDAMLRALEKMKSPTSETRPERITLRRNPENRDERDAFEELMGTDNNYSYLNMVKHNPDRYEDYKIEELDIAMPLTSNEPMMAIRLVKKPNNDESSDKKPSDA